MAMCEPAFLEGELDAQATTNVESIATLAEIDSITQVLTTLAMSLSC